MIAVLAIQTAEPFAVTNAIKNVAGGAANIVASVVYAFLAPVDWSAAVAIGVGSILGGMLGPKVVRVVPDTVMRWVVAMAGVGLAVYLAV
jgi:uncharacterized membrane protein YfcA